MSRADMDALPIEEQTNKEFASSNGANHACGHDLHTAALIGAAHLLSQHRDRVAGQVVFQPQARRAWDGTAAMITEGVLDASGRRADFAHGMDVFSSKLPTGLFCIGPAQCSRPPVLSVTMRGAGGHGSMPHTAKDPVVADAEMIASLQTMSLGAVITVGVVKAATRTMSSPTPRRSRRRCGSTRLDSRETMITLIGATTTTSRLTVTPHCRLPH